MTQLFRLFLFAIILMPLSALANTKVALLISGYGNEGDPGISYDLEELAQSYLVLTQNDVSVDIVSPKGGQVPVHNKKDDLAYIQKFKRLALPKLQATLSASQVKDNDYQALMIIGGDGAMFDLPFDSDTQAFIQGFVNQTKPIAAVCHGPAALVDIKLENGDYFLKGKRVNSFTLKEEKAFSAELIDKFPFMLQTTIESRGARFVSNAPMLPFVAVDGSLITAQNPMSVAKAADALLVKLGITPQVREPFKDEATLQLVATARSQGAFMIDVALAQSKQDYDLNYLALYGFYAYRLAETQAQKRVELGIMERVGKHFSHPQYSLALIRAYVEQDMLEDARQEKASFLAAYPDFELPEDVVRI